MDKNVKKRDTKQWRVGEYLRLSKEDDTSGTSLSIESQKAVIHDFWLKIRCNLRLLKHISTHVGEKVLDEQLLYAVKSQIVLVTEMDKLKQAIISSDSFIDDSKILKSNLSHLEKEQERLEAKIHRLYDDYSDGIIDKELYISRSALLKKELETVKDKIAKIKIEMRQFKKVQIVTDDYAERFKKYETVSEITRELLVDLVDKIIVDKVESLDGGKKKQYKHIKVIFKFADEHRALLSFIHENNRPSGEVKLIAL